MLASRRCLALGLWTVAIATAQDVATPSASPASPVVPPSTEAVVRPVEDKRIFGVLPNNRTTDGSVPFEAISAKRKLTIAFKDSTDLPVYPTAALFASLYQLENQNPSFGQGMQGYAKRFAGAYADQVTGNMFAEGFIPIVTHEDPRYFRQGSGTGWSRLGSALSQIIICRTDSGHKTFNIPEFGGNAIAVGLSNFWYPDTRTASDNGSKLAIQLATDAFSNVLKEFWPDVKRKLQKKHAASSFVSH